jgi:membrane-associated protein
MDLIAAFKALTTHQSELIPLLQTGGLILIIAIVYAENGLFFGFFLPGDYLLFITGILCNGDKLGFNYITVASLIALAAILGNYTGYYFGKFVGKNLFRKKDSLFFKQEYLVKTRMYFMKFGGNTLIISKFLPYVRTFAPIMAGAVDMDIVKFSRYSIIGCLLWSYGLVFLGYFLGNVFPEIINYVHYIVLAFLLITTSVVVSSFFRAKKKIQA